MIKVLPIIFLCFTLSVHATTYMPGYPDYKSLNEIEKTSTENIYPDINSSGFIEMKVSGRDYTDDINKLETIRKDEYYKKIPNDIMKGSLKLENRYNIQLEGKLDEDTEVNYSIQKEPDFPGVYNVYIRKDKSELQFGDFKTKYSSGEYINIEKYLNGVEANTVQNNWKVTYMSSQDAEKPFGKCNKLEFSSSKDLEKMLIKHLSKNHYDSIIHMAAVSDFAPKFVTTTKKLSSKSKKLILEMEQTPKIVNNIKKESKNKDIRLVAFKLTSNEKQSSILKKVNDIFSNADADLIVHNDLSTRVNGIQSSFHIYDENGFISSVKDAKDLGRSVEPKLRKVLV